MNNYMLNLGCGLWLFCNCFYCYSAANLLLCCCFDDFLVLCCCWFAFSSSLYCLGYHLMYDQAAVCCFLVHLAGCVLFYVRLCATLGYLSLDTHFLEMLCCTDSCHHICCVLGVSITI